MSICWKCMILNVNVDSGLPLQCIKTLVRCIFYLLLIVLAQYQEIPEQTQMKRIIFVKSHEEFQTYNIVIYCKWKLHFLSPQKVTPPKHIKGGSWKSREMAGQRTPRWWCLGTWFAGGWIAFLIGFFILVFEWNARRAKIWTWMKIWKFIIYTSLASRFHFSKSQTTNSHYIPQLAKRK